MWAVRSGARREPAGESTGGPDRVRAHTVSGSAPTLRPTPAATACPESRSRQPHLSTLLYAAGRQDANRDAYPGHAAFWKLHQLAVRTGTVDEQSENLFPCPISGCSHDSTVTVWIDVVLLVLLILYIVYD